MLIAAPRAVVLHLLPVAVEYSCCVEKVLKVDADTLNVFKLVENG